MRDDTDWCDHCRHDDHETCKKWFRDVCQWSHDVEKVTR